MVLANSNKNVDSIEHSRSYAVLENRLAYSIPEYVSPGSKVWVQRQNVLNVETRVDGCTVTAQQ